ncbi:sphingomyelin phosphodiesterase-like [Procambarus clarkii]|uniref:sphingomyelin phosphodiesterase-like n=1 Tax=Procambarus clarkii TaxID=6728 RepID=UPI003742743D
MTKPRVSSPTKTKERQPKEYQLTTVPMVISSLTETFRKMLDKAFQALEQTNPQKMDNNDNLKIIQWNIDGFKNKAQTLRLVLIRDNIDIVLFQKLLSRTERSGLSPVTFVTLLALAGASPARPVQQQEALEQPPTPLLAPAGAPPPWASILERLHGPSLGPEDHWPSSNHAKDGVWCLECALALKFLQAELAAGVAYETLVEEAIDICFTTVGYSELYCRGFISMVAPIAYHILSTNNVTASDACGEVLTSQGCTSSSPSRQWTLTIQGQKPPVQPILPPDDGAPRLKVLQLADTHMDPLYQPGSLAVCSEQLCCRNDSGVPENEEDRAWYWGDYRYCGSPRWMLEDMLSHIKLTHPDIDYVMWTGDVVPHNVWSTTKEFNLQLVRETNQMIQDFFPSIPVFPVVGNHEMSPLDQFTNPDDSDTPEELSADWLYQELARQWSRLVPQLDNSTVTRAAYYSVLLQPGFRIISFNSMFGYSSNLWLVEDSQDPGEELAWLEEQLNRAEASGELVHLLGHVPPGILEAERTWSREFNRIVVRYENTIRGLFYGHTHFDELEIFHDGERPVGVAYIAPSQTPWYGLNPAYRIYYVDGDRENSTRVWNSNTERSGMCNASDSRQ